MQTMSNAEENLKRLAIQLPPAPRPVGNYVTWVRAGDLIQTSGHLPAAAEGVRTSGKLGGDMTAEDGYRAARQCGLAILATVRAALGSLDQVERAVRILGLVNATPEFTDHPKVLNGCSDLFAEVFGEPGRSARSALGASSLPTGAAVEVEAVFQVRAVRS
jgi:enamine deaminase RidA (YjgF/YER057c/UK114 family)